MVLKTCSKCKRELPLSSFWAGKNRSGIYPSCKECELSARRKYLADHPLCFKCAKAPHPKGDRYCKDCVREVKRLKPRAWISRRQNLEWCKICEVRPRLPYHQYCHECKMEYQRRQRLNRRPLVPEERRKNNARRYATNLLQRGKIQRGRCVFCGGNGTEFHHYDYEDKTRNFEDVCVLCHDDAHRLIKILVDAYRYFGVKVAQLAV